MSQSAQEHRARAPKAARCAVITVSDTRTPETDTGGQTAADRLLAAGHEVLVREIIPDEPGRMRILLSSLQTRADLDAVLLTGGTGITSRDQTFETVTALLTKPLPGYGELFRMLSFEEVGPAAMLSRAVGGLFRDTLVFTMPGSPAAVRLASGAILLVSHDADKSLFGGGTFAALSPDDGRTWPHRRKVPGPGGYLSAAQAADGTIYVVGPRRDSIRVSAFNEAWLKQ